MREQDGEAKNVERKKIPTEHQVRGSGEKMAKLHRRAWREIDHQIEGNCPCVFVLGKI